jgi:hypothetical protein
LQISHPNNYTVHKALAFLDRLNLLFVTASRIGAHTDIVAQIVLLELYTQINTLHRSGFCQWCFDDFALLGQKDGILLRFPSYFPTSRERMQASSWFYELAERVNIPEKMRQKLPKLQEELTKARDVISQHQSLCHLI